MKKLKGVISVFALSLCLLSPAQAEEQRYISIRNTDMVWVPGNVCVWQFRLDNGGSGEGFGPLTLSLRLKDKGGTRWPWGIWQWLHLATAMPLALRKPRWRTNAWKTSVPSKS